MLRKYLPPLKKTKFRSGKIIYTVYILSTKKNIKNEEYSQKKKIHHNIEYNLNIFFLIQINICFLKIIKFSYGYNISDF
jgi:hypothetical protein